MPYRYNEKNTITNPEYYMYTKYFGRSFIDDYFSQRVDFLKILEDQISGGTGEKPEKIEHDLLNIKVSIFALLDKLGIETGGSSICNINDYYSKLKNKERLNTEKTLLCLLKALLNEPKSSKAEIYFIAKYCLRQYEIKKHIFVTFFSKGEIAGKNNLFIYALCALNLILYHETFRNLNFLNTALKLNDLMCAMIDDADIRTKKVLRFSIHLENMAINELFQMSGDRG